MDTTRLRRTVALLASAALLASLTVATVAAPAAAARPKCDGKVATIVSYRKVIRGTSKADVIVAKGNKNNTIYGYGRRDRICAGRGDDTIYGGHGNDRLFGGSGEDKILGGIGSDAIFGFTGSDGPLAGGSGDDLIKGGDGADVITGQGGDDILRGGPQHDDIQGGDGDDKLYGDGGPDYLDGGDGTDICVSGATIVNCEGLVADFEVEVIAPAQATEGGVPITVKVTNHGPAASGYVLELDRVDGDADCDRPPASTHYGELAMDAADSHQYTIDCSIQGDNPGLTVFAEVIGDATDDAPGNNLDQGVRTILVDA